jgi:hypothetical protein
MICDTMYPVTPAFESRLRNREVERLLTAESNAAQNTYRSAVRRLHAIAAAVPTGIPAPDSNLPLVQAGADCRRAYAALRRALDRWQDFAKNGIIPADLAKSNLAKPDLAKSPVVRS